MWGVLGIGPGAPPGGNADPYNVSAAKQVGAMGGADFMIHGFSLNAP